MLKANRRRLSVSGLAIISIILVSAVILTIVSYGYSVSSADLISRSAVDTVHSNAQVSAHDIAEILKNRVQAILGNIKLISNAPLVQEGNVDDVHILFSTAQEATSDISDSYFWIDSVGKLLWANSFEDEKVYQQFVGADRSDRDYYIVPKQTQQPYITKVIDSVDGVPRLYIAQPIISSDNQSPGFRGVIVSSINVLTLGKFLEGQLAPQFQSTTGLLDKDGQILYSTDHTAIGLDVFGDEFQAMLPEGLKSEFNEFLHKSLEGNAGFEDLSYEGSTGTLAYQPIKLNEDTWSVLYVVTPHTFAGTIQTAIENQRNLSTTMIIAIAGIAVGFAILVVRWNKELSGLIGKRTHELEVRTEELGQSNESLLASNKKLEQAYEDLQVHDRMQREFINVAAHELRTPIQPILGLAEQFNDDVTGTGMQVLITREDIAMLFRNAKRLERLSSDILDVARIEGGGLKLEIEEFDLCEKIRNVIDDVRMKSTSQRNESLNIVYTPREEKIIIQADKFRIFEVISNLLNNAMKFTKHGKIAISAERRVVAVDKGISHAEAIVYVKDTGTGIAADIMPRLFSKFVSKDENGGTGLGLFISKNIIEAHGGRIWADNNKDEKGATFAFSLPIRVDITAQESEQNNFTNGAPSAHVPATIGENRDVTTQ